MHCIIWTGPTRNELPVTYARAARRKGSSTYPQRSAYLSIPGNELAPWERVSTICDNRLCIAPEHIVRCGTIEYFWLNVWFQEPDACWPWLMGLGANGYGQYVMRGQGTLRAHRVAWESAVGPIPDGLSIDHLCRNRGCQNPAHMEPVTPAENTRRGTSNTGPVCRNGHPKEAPGARCLVCQKAAIDRYKAKVASGDHVPRQSKAFCINGHAKDGPGGCKVCQREATRRWQARKRLAL